MASSLLISFECNFTFEIKSKYLTFNALGRNSITHSDTETFLLLPDPSFAGCNWSTEETWSCCSSSNPCGIFEGDCDGDEECAGNLACGTDNCPDFFPVLADCCYVPL